jgi:hypothetical protein
MTGINLFNAEVTAKVLRLLHDLVPKAVRRRECITWASYRCTNEWFSRTTSIVGIDGRHTSWHSVQGRTDSTPTASLKPL